MRSDFKPKKPRPMMWSDDPSPKARSMKNEARLSETVGFKMTPGSGNQHWPGGKGDGSHSVFMFEAKETQRSSISINQTVLAKLCREAATVGKEPALIMSAYGLEDPIPKDWVAVPAELFRYLLEKLEESNG